MRLEFRRAEPRCLSKASSIIPGFSEKPYPLVLWLHRASLVSSAFDGMFEHRHVLSSRLARRSEVLGLSKFPRLLQVFARPEMSQTRFASHMHMVTDMKEAVSIAQVAIGVIHVRHMVRQAGWASDTRSTCRPAPRQRARARARPRSRADRERTLTRAPARARALGRSGRLGSLQSVDDV